MPLTSPSHSSAGAIVRIDCPLQNCLSFGKEQTGSFKVIGRRAQLELSSVPLHQERRCPGTSEALSSWRFEVRVKTSCGLDSQAISHEVGLVWGVGALLDMLLESELLDPPCLSRSSFCLNKLHLYDSLMAVRTSRLRRMDVCFDASE